MINFNSLMRRLMWGLGMPGNAAAPPRKRAKVYAAKARWLVMVAGPQGATVAHGHVFAFTKSEARAMVKKQLGLKRLPVGSVAIMA